MTERVLFRDHSCFSSTDEQLANIDGRMSELQAYVDELTVLLATANDADVCDSYTDDQWCNEHWRLYRPISRTDKSVTIQHREQKFRLPRHKLEAGEWVWRQSRGFKLWLHEKQQVIETRDKTIEHIADFLCKRDDLAANPDRVTTRDYRHSL